MLLAVVLSLSVLAISSWSFHRTTFLNGSIPNQCWLCLSAEKGEITICFVSAYQPPNCASKAAFNYWRAIQTENKWTLQRLKSFAAEENQDEIVRAQTKYNVETQKRSQRVISQGIPSVLRKHSVLGCYLHCAISPNIEFTVHCPFWLAALPTAVCTFVLWPQFRWRSKPGHCPTCHYNLTGNTSGICPECGTPITSSMKIS
jgi:hypothetical protein